jgi:hypothetical protein
MRSFVSPSYATEWPNRQMPGFSRSIVEQDTSGDIANALVLTYNSG